MAFVVALIIWVVTAVSVWMLMDANSAMPATISEMARSIDAQFFVTLVVTGVVFVLAQGLLGLFIFKYRERPGQRARYVHGNNLVEVGGAVVIGVIFVGLAVAAQRVWAALHLEAGPSNQVVVEITGEQFAWTMRYPGADGQFGTTSPELYDAMNNPIGIDPNDAAGRDDVVVTPVPNHHFGGNTGVTGLMCFSDIAELLADIAPAARILLPDVCLSDDGRFLDGPHLDDLPREVEVIPTDGGSLRAALEESR